MLTALENKSTREAEKMIFAQSSNPIALKPDRAKAVGDNIEFQFVGDPALQEKLQKLKGLLAHSHPNISMNELLHKACDLAIEKLTPSNRIKPKPLGAPLSLRGKVAEFWHRAGDRCEQCGSVHALQIDHVRPRALGGSDEISNLRLLCRKCNQRAAIEKLGRDKMRAFLEAVDT